MAHYYINLNEQPKGEHEIHKASCLWLPEPKNREYLGEFSTDLEALYLAQAKHPSWCINGCFWCCPSIDTD